MSQAAATQRQEKHVAGQEARPEEEEQRDDEKEEAQEEAEEEEAEEDEGGEEEEAEEDEEEAPEEEREEEEEVPEEEKEKEVGVGNVDVTEPLSGGSLVEELSHALGVARHSTSAAGSESVVRSALAAFCFWSRADFGAEQMKAAFSAEYVAQSDDPFIVDGSFGVVQIMQRKRDGLKVVKKTFQETVGATHVHREVTLLGLFNHPHIVKLLDFWLVDNRYVLIFEFAGKSFRALTKEWLFACAQLRKICAQLLSALAHVHKVGVVHNDICSDNVLYNRDDGRLCLIDFGSSVPCMAEFSLAAAIKTGSAAGSASTAAVPLYRAPEMLLGHDVPDYSIDIWSAGILFGQLVIGRPLFGGLDLINEIFFLFGKPEGSFWSALPRWSASFPESPKKELPSIFEERVGKAGVDFFTKMCRVERVERAGAEALCKHAFLRDERAEVA